MLRNIPLLFLSALMLFACQKPSDTEPAAIPLCDIHSGPCEGRLDDGTTVRFNITPKPVKALESLQFSVFLEGINDAVVTVDLAMPEMYMGENKVTLLGTGDGNYIGKGSVVKCASGDRLWDAAIKVKKEGAESTIHFRFETMP